MRLWENRSEAVAQNPCMNTPVVGQLYFLEKRNARLVLLRVGQWLSRRGQANAGYVFVCYLRERLPFGWR
jgi:hypothetical protein